MITRNTTEQQKTPGAMTSPGGGGAGRPDGPAPESIALPRAAHTCFTDPHPLTAKTPAPRP